MRPDVAVKRKRKLYDFARAHKIAIPPGFYRNAPMFGKPARELLRRVQMKLGLAPTGVWNQATLDALFPLRPGVKVWRAAKGELGVHEIPSGSNDGPRVREYQRAGGIPHPERLRPEQKAWCACFAKWLWLHVLPPDKLTKATADCTTWLGFSHVPRAKVRQGDMAIYQFDSGDVDHIEVFGRWLVPFLIFRAIGGNTSPDYGGPQSNGGMVCLKTRYVSQVQAFVRVR